MKNDYFFSVIALDFIWTSGVYITIKHLFFSLLFRSNCAENIRKHILHTGKHEGVKMYNCPKCDYGTNIPVEFRNHLKELHPDIENPDLAYLHAGKVILPFAYKFFSVWASLNDCNKKASCYVIIIYSEEDDFKMGFVLFKFSQGVKVMH